MRQSDEMDLFQKLIIATRAPFLGASLMPALVAGALAISEGVFRPHLFLLAAFGVIFAHLGTNVANDYFDHKFSNFPRKKTGPTGGSFAIQNKLFTQRQILALFLACFAVSLSIFALLGSIVGWWVFLLGFAGMLIGFFYTAPPLRLSYNFPLGEIATFIGMGPLLVQTVYFVQAGSFSTLGWPISIFVGALVSNILLAAQLPDEQIDRRCAKRTLTTVCGLQATVLVLKISLIAGAGALLVAYVSSSSLALLGIAGIYPYARAFSQIKKGNYPLALEGCISALNWGALLCCIGLLL